MSRLENKKAAGYFPTPSPVTELIAQHLAPPTDGGVFRWLDPCSGAGTALAYLARVHGGRTYGIELDAERAEASAQVLDKVLQGDFAAQRLPKGDNAGISATLLNPPYDHDDRAGGRLELVFLRDTQDWLASGAVLIYIIPQYRITHYIAKRLATHFRDIRIYRFPDGEYEQFRQVVIFGVKRAQPEKDDKEVMRIAQAKTAVLPVLPSTYERPYVIPSAPDRPFFFRSAEAKPEDVLEEAIRVGVWHSSNWEDLLTPHSQQSIQPLMPLRRGHIAMVLAAGLLDNMVVAKNGQELLVKGRLQKTQVDTSTEEDRENKVQRTREQFQASITTLDLETGEIARMNDEGGLRWFLTEWQDALGAQIVETFEPMHQMTYDELPGFLQITNHHSKHRHLPGRERTGLFEAQRQVVAALTRRFLAGERFALLQATMGTGKTTISVSLADVLKKTLSPNKPFPVIVQCPPHLTEKWPREIAGVVPMARAMVIRRPRDLAAYVEKLNRLDPRTLFVAVVSSEMLKLGSGWTAAVVRQRGRYRREVEVERDGVTIKELQRFDTFACPKCGGTIHDRDETGKPTYPITDYEHFTEHRVTCNNLVLSWVGNPEGYGGHCEEVECGEPLYQEWRGHWPKPERDGFGNLLPLPDVRYPLAKLIHKRYPELFELAVVDEIHENKAQSSDRGHAFGTLVRACRRTLGMTGTLFGGTATSLFYLLHRLDPRIRAEFAWRDGQRFAGLYGVLERVSKAKKDEYREEEYGHYTGLRRVQSRVIERPGISPALVTRLLDSTVFLTLEDLGFDLPEYVEKPVVLPMRYGNGSGPDQGEVYHRLHASLQSAAREDWSLMAEYLQTTLAWPNACWRDEETSVGTIPALPDDCLYPKEEWLVGKCQEQHQQARRVLLFVRQTATRDIRPRLAEILRDAGLHVASLGGKVPTQRREAWVERRVKQGLDVLICNPRLVQTGLDLLAFPTLIFYEPEYSIYLIMQASRRSWRLGQTQPVEVYHAVYADTMEHRAVAHVGKKVAAAQLLYGDDVAGALVDQAGAGGSFLEELARDVVANTEVPDLGELFVQHHRAYEGSGWLLGNAKQESQAGCTETDGVKGSPATDGHSSPLQALDPDSTVQLSLL